MARGLLFSVFYTMNDMHMINIFPSDRKTILNNVPIFKFYNYINNEIIDKNKNPLILMMPESRVAYLKEWDKTIITDHWASYWGEILRESNSLEEAKEILLRQKITHIIFSKNFYFWIRSFARGDDVNKYSIFKNFQKFEEFKEKYLNEKYCEGGLFCVYEIK